jgi:SSS family solute:Na+ symporter
MSHAFKTILFICLSAMSQTSFSQSCPFSDHTGKIQWDSSWALPATEGKANIGVAGAFSGFIGETLVVAGGANFPDNVPWRGGHKTWYNRIYSIDLSQKSPQWSVTDNLMPEALAYGVSIQLPEGVLCIGGCGKAACSDKVFLLGEKEGHLTVSTDWPSLPTPLADATGALSGNKIYVAGGQERMDKQEATKHFYVLDLTKKEQGWKELAAWDGEPRGYAVSAVQSDGKEECFYLFGGRNYRADGYVQVLTDGYEYHPQQHTWKLLKGSFPVMAGTAFALKDRYIVFCGGVPKLIDGSDNHPGFDNTIRVFNTRNHQLKVKETSPYPIAVTTNLAYKDKTFFITSGEVKPGIRTPLIIKGKMTSQINKNHIYLNHK